jgi:hypothetical protein
MGSDPTVPAENSIQLSAHATGSYVKVPHCAVVSHAAAQVSSVFTVTWVRNEAPMICASQRSSYEDEQPGSVRDES